MKRSAAKMEQVLFTTNKFGLATITLNRPEALNALTNDMIHAMTEQLIEWEKDPTIKVVLFTSSIERAFCAGGDMKSFYDVKQTGGDLEEAAHFFKDEYKLDELVYNYKKPIVANLNGIVMGGGVGLTQGATYKIVTETTKWAMPEMNISFFPDVGAAYFLNKAPGKVGRYVALTSQTYEAADVLYMRAANVYVPSEDLTTLLDELEHKKWSETEVEEELKTLINKYSTSPNEKSTLAEAQKKIDTHFRYDSLEEIVQSLKKAPTTFSNQTVDIIEKLSPVSLKVTLEQMKRGANMTFRENLTMDFKIARRFLYEDDFYEGVRSVLVDKDRNPTYKYKSISEVSDDLVKSFFE